MNSFLLLSFCTLYKLVPELCKIWTLYQWWACHVKCSACIYCSSLRYRVLWFVLSFFACHIISITAVLNVHLSCVHKNVYKTQRPLELVRVIAIAFWIVAWLCVCVNCLFIVPLLFLFIVLLCSCLNCLLELISHRWFLFVVFAA